ncbi:MAG: phosphoribosylformimino-5-aminoimidazole carboxamide ribotide isomerase, partial [Eubacterium sp.]|nr:phosphoribosylformimino-5-aminoimidazole carboxamide ribotide isomerase [Eubacterium sp.]
MKFRPCIDIHNGKVKQIVGGSLRDGRSSEASSTAEENFVSDKDAAWYAAFYRERNLTGGHVILLNAAGSAEYEATRKQAESALRAWPGGLQIGGGITSENAADFLEAGASHVIVTSYVFRNGRIDRERLEGLRREVGKEHLVLDLSCRKKD